MYPEKIRRNAQIYGLRKKGVSYRQLSKIYSIGLKALYEIVKRYDKREKNKA